MVERIAETPGANLDYAAIVDADSFQPIAQIAGPAVAAIAVKFGATRMIDNMELIPS
jgi:pantoate--beta-alanine ligase